MRKEESQMNDNSFGVSGVIFGVLSIVFSSITGIVLGIIGLIFSIKQNKVMKNKWAKAGIILFIYALNSVLNNPDFLSQLQQITNAQ